MKYPRKPILTGGILFRDGIELKLFLTAVLVYLLFQRAGGAGARYITLVYSLVRDKTFAIDPYLYISSIDTSFYKGHFYLAAQPGPSVLAAPFYALARIPLSLLHVTGGAELLLSNLFMNFAANVIPIAYSGVLFFRLAEKFTLTKSETLKAAVAYYFGTMIFVYATEFMVGDSLGMLFCLLAFYQLFTFNERPSIFKTVTFGGFMGLAVCMSMVTAPVLLVLAFYSLFVMKPARLPIAAASGAAFIALLMLHNKICYGGWTTDYLSYMTNKEFLRLYANGALEAPKPGPLLNLTVLPYRGYFLYMPIMIPALAAAALFLAPGIRSRRNFRESLAANRVKPLVFYVIFLVFLSALLFSSGHVFWNGGASWGPRYLLSSVPFMLLLSASFFRYIKPFILNLLIAVSILINAVGGMGVPHGRSLTGYFSAFFTEGWRPQIPIVQILVAKLGLFSYQTADAKTVFLFSCLALPVSIYIIYLIWKPRKDIADKPVG